jgi:hypothetical protein
MVTYLIKTEGDKICFRRIRQLFVLQIIVAYLIVRHNRQHFSMNIGPIFRHLKIQRTSQIHMTIFIQNRTICIQNSSAYPLHPLWPQ